MAIRIAAASALALAAALVVAQPARAQFFSFFQMSPGQIVGMLNDDGYQLRGPMMRRGNVYVCDVVSVTGRPARLIVDARDGRVLERFAAVPHRRRFDDEPDALRPPRDVGDDGPPRSADDEDRRPTGRRRWAATSMRPRGSMAATLCSIGSRRRRQRRRPIPSPNIMRAASARSRPSPKDSTATPAATADAKASDKPADAASSVAAVAPSAGVAPAKPEAAPKAVAPKSSATPKPAPSPEREQAKADTDAPAATAPAPKAEAPHKKKLNDLPVGTLD